MGANSNIEWTDHTFNPWIGCTKVSPGCANCYAAAQDKFRSWTPQGWGRGKPRKHTSVAYWKQPVQWDREAGELLAAYNREVQGSFGHLDEMMEEPHRPRVFCASLADWLDDEVPTEWRGELLALIRDTPNLDWLLLTKRPQNFARLIEAAQDWHFDHGDRNVSGWLSDWRKHGIAPENVWIGTSVEDQERAEERIPELVFIPARVRFLSCEPLLGPVNLSIRSDSFQMVSGIHWVIHRRLLGHPRRSPESRPRGFHTVEHVRPCHRLPGRERQRHPEASPLPEIQCGARAVLRVNVEMTDANRTEK